MCGKDIHVQATSDASTLQRLGGSVLHVDVSVEQDIKKYNLTFSLKFMSPGISCCSVVSAMKHTLEQRTNLSNFDLLATEGSERDI